ncbi:MAG TPA: tetratricopeptide repeat protein, partial [Thermomicrobiales bacterium]|nr:tetratricopeptide repeat protein [Thermomicrobiales bacterium]
LAFAEPVGLKVKGSAAAGMLAALEREHGNLRAAMAWLGEHGDGDRLVRLAGALWPFWREHAHYREGRQWLERALDLGREATTADRLRALTGAGAMAWYQGDVAAARNRFEQGLALAQAMGDRPAEGYLLSNLSAAATEVGDDDRAAAYGEAALAIARESDDAEPTIVALHNLAHTDWLRGRAATAAGRLEEALTLARSHEVGWLAPSILNGLGTTVADLGDQARAAAFFREGLELGRVRGNPGDVVDALEGLARVDAAGGQAAGAARRFGAAASLRDEIGMPHVPSERAYLEPVWIALRGALGNESFAAAWADGRALTPEQAAAPPSAPAALPHRGERDGDCHGCAAPRPGDDANVTSAGSRRAEQRRRAARPTSAARPARSGDQLDDPVFSPRAAARVPARKAWPSKQTASPSTDSRRALQRSTRRRIDAPRRRSPLLHGRRAMAAA